MKKILLSIMMAVASLGMLSAAEITMDFAGNEFGLPVSASGTENAGNIVAPVTKGNISLTCNKGTAGTAPRLWSATAGIDLRIYKGSTFTISSTNGDNITSIVFVGTTKATASVGEYNATTQIWTGSAQSVVFSPTATTNIKTIAIVTVAAGGVASPTFSPAGGDFYAAQSVELSCATAGAEIRYTTNGSTPSASSTLYSAPIAVSATTTIKAIAIKGGVNSDVVEATYTIKTLPEVADIAAFLATNTSGQTKTDLYKISNTVKVLYQSKPYLFVTDNSACLQVYGQVDNMYSNGDIIPAGIIGSVAYYGGLPQMVPQVSSFVAGTTGPSIKPENWSVEELSADLVNHYIVLKYITINSTDKTLTDDTGSVAYFNRFTGVNAPTDNQKYDVVGIMNSFNGTMQVFPISFTLAGGIEGSEISSTSIMGGNGAITVSADSDAKILIVNPFGQTIVNKTIAAGENRIDVAGGLYVVKVNNIVKKVIVK